MSSRDTVKVLEMVRPFVSVIPEVSKPERKVSGMLCDASVNGDCYRFNSERKCYGRQSPCSFSWCVVRFPYLE